MAPPHPRTLGRYVVYQELASGGMASVYYARQLGPSGFARTVVVKQPHPHLATDPAFCAMLIDEALLASRIRHPNVVTTLDVIATPAELALAMDYIHGESLARLANAAHERGERVPVPTAAAIMIDALRGLHAAHEATDAQGRPLGIVHRDISPQNLLVGADGITRVADFGVAKAAGRLFTTQDGAIKGKYAYMAPEQIRGGNVRRTTDIYAAAIVLWELLTGEGLFRGETESEVFSKCLEGLVEAPSRRDATVPAAFDAIVMRGLSRVPEERYATAREMAADLERAAPAVRSSEVGAWVERLAKGPLAHRAAIIAEMEASAEVGAQPGDPASPLEEAPTQVKAPPRVALPSVERSQISHPGVVAERVPVAAPKHPRTRIVLGALAGVLVLATYGALSIARRPPSGAAASGDANAAPTPSVIAPVVSADAIRVVPPAASSAAAIPSATASARPPARPPTRGTKHPPPGCDPPYTIDSEGREVFKLQCL